MSTPAQAHQPMEHVPSRAALHTLTATRLETTHQRKRPPL